MRYYSVQIGNGTTYTTLNADGSTNPSALQIEIDIPVASADLPTGDAMVKIWGIPLDTIGQANNLVNKTISVFGGFKKGLPLANPAQSGLLAQGYILNAYGNWIDTDQWMVLLIRPGPAPTGNSSITGGTPDPRNLSFVWPKGQPMSTAIKNCLTTGFPGCTVTTNISPNLVYSQDQSGQYPDLTHFSQEMKQISRSIIGGTNYPGVSIVPFGNTFTVIDGMGSGSPAPAASSSSAATFPAQSNSSSTPGGSSTAIAFTDLIGQPSWQNAPLINFKAAMRADLKVGQSITLPKTLVTNSAQAQGFLVNQKVAFQGSFFIQSLRHLGNLRQSDSGAWVTVIDAYPTQQATNTGK